jgi:phosphatidate cytidylyltransferase
LEPENATPAPTLPQDVVPRLVSGIVLAVGALALTWAGVWPFTLLVLAVALIIAWEWGGIVRGASVDTIFVVSALAIAAAILLTASGTPGLALITLAVGAILAALLGFGDRGHLSSLGVLYAGLPAISLIWLRSSPQWGFTAVLFVFLLVWATDTGAYIAGRVFGGPRLAPRWSPNKTWAGLVGGVAAGMLVVAALGYMAETGTIGRMVIGAGVLAVVAQAGDITESALKRQHGVKDASALIPGHGGFMDRVDGLIFSATFAAVFGLLVNVHDPARALVMWH